MKDKDFYTEITQYADGYIMDGDCIVSPDGTRADIENFTAENFPVHHGDILQRAIEGVNRISFNRGTAFYPYRIHQGESSYDVEIFNSFGATIAYERFHFAVKMNHVVSKRAALEYIIKQERNR